MVPDILRVFDLSSKYGPCVGITRLQRWERAKKWGLNPPEEVRFFRFYLQLHFNVSGRAYAYVRFTPS